MPGFTLVYTETEDEDSPQVAPRGRWRSAAELQRASCSRRWCRAADQHFHGAAPRFTEASLVKELEEKGIGRPSTYATILLDHSGSRLRRKKEGRFHPTDLGKRANELLVQSFPDILNVDFTARMETDLDEVEEGQREMLALLTEFYGPFKTDVEKSPRRDERLKRSEIPTELQCEKCGQTMVIKWGRNGEFSLAVAILECKTPKSSRAKKTAPSRLVLEPTTDEKCPTCGADLIFRRGRLVNFGPARAIRVQDHPSRELGHHLSETRLVALTERRSRRGSPFFGCSNYSAKGCDFVSWDRPIKEPCPDCGAPFLLKKQNRSVQAPLRFV